ncbi:MAG TPA: ketoacyl-ACP synthase III [Bacteroidales bacterium]|nr:ketoacyl-ACP synthase III [Bacteroidales bacterium]HPS73939.1 ketoacyl-ACP synthase III [Bacteroidales bacterium]
MALLTLPDIRIAGLSAAVPRQREHNADYAWISKKERESLIKVIGVEERRVAPKGVTTADLCVPAAEQLLADLGWDKNEVGLLVFVSQSRDYLVPTTACILQNRLGLSHECAAFDIGLGCSGYVYGLSVVASMMQSGSIRKALLLVGDISTITAAYRDKSTHPLFGDVGTVTALEYKPGAAPMEFNLQTDGAGYKALMIQDGGARNIFSQKSLEVKKISQGIYRSRLNLELDGIEVFNFSLREVVPNINTLLKHTGKTLSDVDYVIFHQANRLINETLRKMLRLEKEKVPYSIREFGNTSGASVPLTMITQLAEPMKNGHLRFLLTAFGVGLSWGSVLVDTDHLVCPDLIEY